MSFDLAACSISLSIDAGFLKDANVFWCPGNEANPEGTPDYKPLAQAMRMTEHELWATRVKESGLLLEDIDWIYVLKFLKRNDPSGFVRLYEIIESNGWLSSDNLAVAAL